MRTNKINCTIRVVGLDKFLSISECLSICQALSVVQMCIPNLNTAVSLLNVRGELRMVRSARCDEEKRRSSRRQTEYTIRVNERCVCAFAEAEVPVTKWNILLRNLLKVSDSVLLQVRSTLYI